MSRKRLKVVVTRRLPDAVETRMSELFDVTLSPDDRPMTREQLTAWLDAAHQAADAAESIINHYYHGQFDVMSKSDSTPVTQADIEAEQAIREVLLGTFPDHGWFAA